MTTVAHEAPAAGAWRPWDVRAAGAPALGVADVHVWRVRLDVADAAPRLVRECADVLSAAERARAGRFHAAAHRDRFVVAHGVLRRVLGAYAGREPQALEFTTGLAGKPALADARAGDGGTIEFNLSHSADLAVVAVARGRAVGVDVEREDAAIEHESLSEHFFSPGECAELRAVGEAGRVAGFFAAWSRKEAYLKATGEGITNGLHHFDVSLAPGAPARLLEDRSDGSACDRWVMAALDPAPGYAGALVVEAPLDAVRLLDAGPCPAPR
ncbi:4'-phosphopantetheinyl transferase [Gemmatimonadetes bacterium T265]|nr:4'-phosphopantetheinyl transferase [Gemmatimonadetes bacterium T265]